MAAVLHKSEDVCPRCHTQSSPRLLGALAYPSPTAGGTLKKALLSCTDKTHGTWPPWITVQCFLHIPVFSGEINQGRLPVGGSILLGLPSGPEVTGERGLVPTEQWERDSNHLG